MGVSFHTDETKKKISLAKKGVPLKPRTPKYKWTCQSCKAEEEVLPYLLKRKYCSRECAQFDIARNRTANRAKIIIPSPLACECGCGKNAKPGKRFINHHNLKGGIINSEHGLKIAESNRGKRRSKETRKNMSESAKRAWAEGRQTWNEARRNSHLQPELRQLRREIALRNWANGVYDPGFALKYSSYEMMLAPLVKPLGFKATYSHPFRITCKDRTRLPDFVNPETREVIELFGTWWHRDKILPNGQQHETPEYVIEKYAEVGYKCRVVWIEEEFDDFVQEIKVNGTVLIEMAKSL